MNFPCPNKDDFDDMDEDRDGTLTIDEYFNFVQLH